MNGSWLGLLALAGYISTPLVSLIGRAHWPSEVRFLVAIVIAGGAAVAMAAATGPLTPETILSGLGAAFAAQQATFHLSIPGAGSAGINARLESIGSITEADADDLDPTA